ncbi:hypothetical protein Patl1_05597 [Pistacia atlantica]|uniref:Uncharacterized protein n=1 Tax=Pistacia atlantica TaxID=434234 RepID=A0ACC1BWT7_9ROSI|nr:hypothetical protein Patl1_05597 [Pistacia atlantica]
MYLQFKIQDRVNPPLPFRSLFFSTLKMQASDRFNINSQLEHLQAKYVGTGHADLNRFEWAVNIQRDSYASYVGHYPILSYFAIAENESIGREHYNFMQISRFKKVADICMRIKAYSS